MAHVQDRGTEGNRKRWQARYRTPAGDERTRSFDRKVDARQWLDEQTAALVTGRWIDPARQDVTVGEWCREWLSGYNRRPSTVRQARTHLRRITDEFGDRRLRALRPSHVRSWVAKLKDEGLADSYIHALHARLSQVLTDAVHDRLIPENPCSRRTSPPTGETRPYVATTDQVMALYEAFPERRRVAVLLGAYAGLRTGEACGLRVEDVAFLELQLRPAVQYPAEPLKTEMSRAAVPLAESVVEALSVQVGRWPSRWVVSMSDGGQVQPRTLQRDMRQARGDVDVPEGFRFHDLRHYYASLLIASGADVKVVQHRVRHGSASHTLDTYGHLWPDRDETTREAVQQALRGRLAERSRNEREAR